MENRAKLRFPRSLLSTLTSCRTQNLLSDVIQHQNHHQLNPIFSSSSPEIPFSSTSIDPLLPPHTASPVRRSYTSICRPRCPETFDEIVRDNCILPGERRKVCSQTTDFFQNDVVGVGRKGPPVSPVSPLKPYYKLEKQRRKEKKKKKKLRRTRFGRVKPDPFSSDYEDLFSSDDEREEDDETETETETLFSSSRSFLSLSSSRSISFSSDPNPESSTRVSTRRRPPSAQRREARKKEVGAPALEEKVKGSFAVVKKSRDPYTDFRTSMVEMIMEKQIFGAKELEQLLQCFLSLNPAHHHRIIVQVFAEICDALFSNFCC